MNPGKPPTTQKKRKFLRFTLVLFLGSTVLLALFYSYFAYMPTGYEEFEEELAQRLGVPLKPPERKNPEPPSTPKKRKIAFHIKPEDLPGNGDDAPTTLTIPKNRFPVLDFDGFPEKLGIGSAGVGPRKTYFRMEQAHIERNRDSFVFNEEGTVIIEPTSKCIELIRMNVRSKMAHSGDLFTDFPKTDFLKGLREADVDWGKGLDILDPLTTKREFVSQGEWVARILMACAARGDTQSATEYLKRYLQDLRVWDRARFYKIQDQIFIVASAPFMLLGQMENFSEEGFQSAREYFDSVRVDFERREDYRAEHAIAARVRFMRDFEQERMRRTPNSFHYLWSGVPEETVHRFLLPAMNRQIDHLTMALARGRTSDVLAAHKQIVRLGKLMNFGERSWGYRRIGFGSDDIMSISFSFPTAPSAQKLQLALGGYNNFEPDFPELIIAASYYRHTHGRFPERIEELVPKYLPDTFLPSPQSTWAIIPIKRFHQPITTYYKDDYDTQEPFSLAVKKYMENESKVPDSLEDLKKYLPNDLDPELFRDRFTWFEARPAFLRFRILQSGIGTTTKNRIVIDVRWPNLILTPLKGAK